MVRHRRGDEFPTLIKPIAKLSLTAAEPTINHWILWITWALSATCSPSKGLSHLWPKTTLVGCRLVMWGEDYVGSCWTCPVLRTVRWSWSPEPAQRCLPCPATEGLCPRQWRHWPQSFAVTVLSQMAFLWGSLFLLLPDTQNLTVLQLPPFRSLLASCYFWCHWLFSPPWHFTPTRFEDTFFLLQFFSRLFF